MKYVLAFFVGAWVLVTSAQAAGYRVETVASGLEHPWSLAFLPGGRMLVTERAGRLRVIEPGSDGRPRLRTEPVANVPAVLARGQAGLFDVVVDPAFSWGEDMPPRRAWTETVIYEAHPKGLTAQHPGVEKGLRGSYLAVFLQLLMTPWLIILMKNFMRTVPYEIVESGKVDGAGDFRIFAQLCLPMMKPALATIGLFLALSYWNEWYLSSIYLGSTVEFRTEWAPVLLPSEKPPATRPWRCWPARAPGRWRRM